MNLIVIKGRLVRDPELRQTGNGTSVCTVDLAVDRPYSKEKETDFFTVVFWRQAAEFVAQYFTKGREMLVQGEMQSRKYEDKEGNNRIAWEVKADRVEFCGNKSDGGGSDEAPAAKKSASGNKKTAKKDTPPPTALGDDDGSDDDGDLPF